MVQHERIEFTGSLGERLAARLDLPQGKPRGYALFAHCFTCSKDVFAASRVSAQLAVRGFGVLRFDFTGLGESDGEFANTNFSSNVADLFCAVDYLREHREAPRLLIGHSLGGAAVLAAASGVPEAVGVATIGAPSDTAHVAHHFASHEEEIQTTGEAEVRLGGRPFRIKRQFLQDIRAQKLEASIAKLGKALLVLHAPRDQIVGIENAALIFGAAKHPKSFVSLDDADHLLTRKEDAIYAAEVIAAWSGKFLPPVEAVAIEGETGEVRVEETLEGKFAQRITVGGRHALLADEPVAVGGTDRGPTPYDLLLAGLGACTAMTIRLYATRKKLSLRQVQVRLRHRKTHATDCAGCESGDARIDRIDRVIALDGELDESARENLLRIAEKCPVHKTLHSTVEVHSSLSD